MTAKSGPRGKRRRPASPVEGRVTRAIRGRRNHVQRRMVELAGIQHRCERRGDHRLAARALKERRYLEFVSLLLRSDSSKTRTQLRPSP